MSDAVVTTAVPPESSPAPPTSPQVEAEAEASPSSSSESRPVRGPLDAFAGVSFARRWLFTTVLLALFVYRILSVQGFYIVPYALALALITHYKKYRKAVEAEAARAEAQDHAADQMEKGVAPAPAAPVADEKAAASESEPLLAEKNTKETADTEKEKDGKADTESKADAAPAEPQDLVALEFTTWKASTYATLVAIPCAYMSFLDFPVYWPILASYAGFVFLFEVVLPPVKRVRVRRRATAQTAPNVSI